MAKGRINKTSVELLTWKEGGPAQQFQWDDKLRGFGFYVLSSGYKTYCVQYKRDGRSQRIKIGPHGALTPDQAREEAKRILGRVYAGEDPVADKKDRKAARTVNAVLDDFLERIAEFKKPNTAKEWARVADKHIRPEVGTSKLRDLKRADVTRMRSEMKATPAMANKLLDVLSSLWSFAVKAGEVKAINNPVKLVDRYKSNKRERFLTTDELRRLGDVLRQGETVGLPYEVDDANPKAKHARKPEDRVVVLDPFSAAAIQLLLLTGARLREILHARWEWVDFERGILFLPDSKTGRKPVYLSAAALEILATLPRVAGNPHLFPGAKAGEPRSDLNRPWQAVRRAAGLEGVRLHDLRHSFASFGAGASLGLPIIGKLLGHSVPQTTARYSHLAEDPVRRAADTIGATIATALGGTPGADVKPLRRKK